MSNGAAFILASSIVNAIVSCVTSGTPPITYPFAVTGQMAEHPFWPGTLSIFAGAPGSGKTAYVMQIIVEALRFNLDLRVLVCNVEMSVDVLVMRLISNLSGVPLTDLLQRQIKPEDKLNFLRGVATFESVADRLAFIKPPFTLENVAAVIGQFSPHILVLDYIQRFGLAQDVNIQSDRQRIGIIMDTLRDFANAGLSIVAVSALSRGKGEKGGSNYKSSNITMANLRESSEVEFGADDIKLLFSDGMAAQRIVYFRHEKSRNGECKDMTLLFDGTTQRFSDITVPAAPAASQAVPEDLLQPAPEDEVQNN